MKTIGRPLLVVFVAAVLSPAVANSGEWGIGVGIAHNRPAQKGAEPELTGGPFPFFEGERLSLGFGSVSYVIADTGGILLSLEGQARFDGYDPAKSDALTGMRKRNPAMDAGFSLSSGGAWGHAELKILGDITGTHKGYEVSATYQLPYRSDRWTLVRSIGLSWRSENLVDYYYGVRANEAQAGRPSYTGRAGLNATVGLAVDYMLTDRWHAVGGADLTYLGDNIKDSPIIDKNHEASVFTALVYRF